MKAHKKEQYNNIEEKVSHDKSEQKYGENIIKGRKGWLFDVGTLVTK